MTKITTDFVGTESTVVTKSRLTEILAYWGASTAGYTTWGQARTDLNVRLLNTTAGVIGNEELAGSFLPKINFLNDPDDMVLDALFGAGEQGVWFDPSDVANIDWRRNLLLWTEAFNESAWVKSAVGTASVPVVTANADVAPDGTNTADLVVFNRGAGTSGDRSVLAQSPALSAGIYTQSVWLKAATAGDVGKQLALRNVAGAGYLVVTLTDTWVRHTKSETWAVNSFEIANRQGVTADVTVSVLLWGAQLETGSVATEYQPITNLNNEIITRFPNATMYQDYVGTTPVYAPNQPVGLRLDKSKGLVLGAELRGAGFTGLVGTPPAAAYDVVTGIGSVSRVDGSNRSFVRFTTSSVSLYRVVIQNTGASSLDVGASGSTAVAAGQSATLIVGLNTSISIFATSNGTTATFVITSVRELAGNHATQSTDISRPLYGIEPAGGRRNLLTYTEDLSNAAWVKVRATVTANAAVAPDGTTTADGLVGDTSNNSHYIQQVSAIPASTATSYVVSVYAKPGDKDYISIVVYGSGSSYRIVIVRLSTGTFSQGAGAAITGSLLEYSAAPNGFYRIAVRFDGLLTGLAHNVDFLPADSQSANTFVGDGTTINTYFWGAQVELGSVATPYQKVVSAYEVTEAGVQTCHYCNYDGTNDGMLTNSIDFTATDKMSVFAAVRKSSDVFGFIAEFGPNMTTSNGGFGLFPAFAATGWGFGTRGTVFSEAVVSTGYAAPSTNVLTGLGDISGDRVTLRIDSTQAAQATSDQGTGNYGNYPLYLGRRGGSSLPFNGRDYGIIVTGKLASSTQIGNAESFLLNKLGSLAPVITGVPTIGVN